VPPVLTGSASSIRLQPHSAVLLLHDEA
jgi:hypothetical protein